MSAEKDLTDVAERLQFFDGFDVKVFDLLVEDTNAIATLRILARFCMSLDESLPHLQHGVQDGNPEIIGKAAHKLAGSAEMLGFKTFGDRSKSISSRLKHATMQDLPQAELRSYIQDTHTLCDRIKSDFPQWQTYL